ncbi:MAG TPA: FAD:protein FMN transferase [Gammaproteobacteria bacterium]|nr:FAD:protein FMN transferase [Gammaproteobacteria bacterium]
MRLAASSEGWLGTFDAMASTCEVHVDAADREVAARVLASVAAEARRVEAKFSRYRDDNIVAAINTAAGSPITVDDETARLIDYAAQLFELSEGKFDITSGVLRRIWRFDGSDRVPSHEQIENVKRLVGWQRVRWRRPVIALAPGMEIDFGGIGKEYAVDRAAALVAPFTERCLLNFGGDLRALGAHADGRPWQVGIEAVERLTTASRIVEVYRGGIATSGDSRRYLLKDGRRYGHILDPTTGEPVVGAPRSVTVVADTCTQAGMLATLAMLHGRAAEAFLAAQGARYWCYR